jgi:hypothetical protein
MALNGLTASAGGLVEDDIPVGRTAGCPVNAKGLALILETGVTAVTRGLPKKGTPIAIRLSLLSLSSSPSLNRQTYL